jgi:hypothetical protein
MQLTHIDDLCQRRTRRLSVSMISIRAYAYVFIAYANHKGGLQRPHRPDTLIQDGMRTE